MFIVRVGAPVAVTVTEPVREAVPVLAVTVSVNPPLPLRLEGNMSCIPIHVPLRATFHTVFELTRTIMVDAL